MFEYNKPKPRTAKPIVTLLLGPPDTGKSYYVRQHAVGPNPYWQILQRGEIWWDDYDGTSAIILDDFYGWIPYSVMLRLLDRCVCMDTCI